MILNDFDKQMYDLNVFSFVGIKFNPFFEFSRRYRPMRMKQDLYNQISVLEQIKYIQKEITLNAKG
jgi:hypothetical protein